MYPCTECGQCCKHISGIDDLMGYDKGDGQCRYLSEDNKCKIYMTRPMICRIDESYEKKYFREYDRTSFYKKNAMACNDMQINADVSEIFRVIIEG